MVGLISKPDTHQKLQILSADSQYDLACACSTSKNEHRTASKDGKWIYPVTLPNGGKTVLLKTLLSNVCSSDCKYCPLRQQQDIRRCSMEPEEIAQVFMNYHYQRKVYGLFLTSGLLGHPDKTMEKLNATARLLRKKHQFKGYIHLKIIPGASDAAVEDALGLANAVSLNIETPGEKNLTQLSSKKNYIRDIIGPMKLISKLTGRGERYQKVKQTTQFIVGAAGEKDAEIIKYMFALYQRLNLHRIYFSAYQKGLGDQSIAGERNIPNNPKDIIMREHRLYQADFLFRKYGFSQSEIVFNDNDQLSLQVDPKQAWADQHQESFPINVNRADRWLLLRVPGLGPTTVARILKIRTASKITSLEQIGKIGVRLQKAGQYLTF